MDDKLRSEVMDDIEYLQRPGYGMRTISIGSRFEQVMTDYEHLELQMLQAKRVVEALVDRMEAVGYFYDQDFAAISHAKAFLEENDGG